MAERVNPFKGKAECGTAEHKALDAAEVRRALALLCDPAGEAEVRCLRPNRSAVRSGSDVDGLTAAALAMGKAQAIYLCLNPVELGAPCGRAASDKDVTRREWLFLDVDSIRPKDVCATDAEKKAAQGAAAGLKEHLAGLGWPEPVEVDSGNGAYLLYRIDLPNDDASALLCRRVLHALAEEFPGAKLDRAVHNASRIARLPGTWNQKGRNDPDRPHRMCRLLGVPDVVGVVTRGRLEAVAGPAPAPAEGQTKERKNPFKGRASDSRLQAYCRNAINSEVLAVAMASRGHEGGGGANNALNEAAFSLGTMLDWGCFAEDEVAGLLDRAARRAGLEDAEIGPTIQSGLRAGKASPRPLPEWAERGGPKEAEPQAAASEGPKVRWEFTFGAEFVAEGSPDEVRESVKSDEDDAGVQVRRFEVLTLGDLLGMDFPEPRWVIRGVMSEGLNILAGAPKQGKSMLALNVALTVAGGGKALGDVQVEAADVLYLSLEDRHRRVKSRAVRMLTKLRPGLADSVSGRLSVVTDWPRQHEGGLKLIDLWARRVASPGLVIIDVWNRFAPPLTRNGSAYAHDADAMGEVKRFVERRGFSALVVHHTRKPGMRGPDDFVNEVSGTLGLSGAADGVLVLTRSRQDVQASLHVTGRDVADQEIVLEFDVGSLTWSSLGTKAHHVEGRVQEKVVRFLRSQRPTAYFVKDIAEQVGEKDDSVKKACANLVGNKIVRKVGHAFSYPGEAVDPDPGEGEP